MKKWIVVLLLALIAPRTALCGLTMGVLGRPDQVQGRVGFRPAEGRLELGGFGLWHEDGDILGGGAYLLYDVLNVSIATWYVGAMGGVTDYAANDKDDEVDIIARVLTGITIGNDTIRVGPEYQYVFDDSVWSELAPIEDQHQVFLNLTWRF